MPASKSCAGLPARSARLLPSPPAALRHARDRLVPDRLNGDPAFRDDEGIDSVVYLDLRSFGFPLFERDVLVDQQGVELVLQCREKEAKDAGGMSYAVVTEERSDVGDDLHSLIVVAGDVVLEPPCLAQLQVIEEDLLGRAVRELPCFTSADAGGLIDRFRFRFCFRHRFSFNAMRGHYAMACPGFLPMPISVPAASSRSASRAGRGGWRCGAASRSQARSPRRTAASDSKAA